MPAETSTVPALFTAPANVPVPLTVPNARMSMVALVSVPRTFSTPACTSALVAKLPELLSVQALPCIDRVSKLMNFAMLSLPAPSRIRLSVPVSPLTRPLSTEPVSSFSVRVLLPLKLMALTAPVMVPELVTVPAALR